MSVRLLAVLACGAFLWSAPAHAQGRTGGDAPVTRSGPVRLTGTISGGAEGYASSLSPGRRPPASAFTSADLAFSLYGVQSGVNLVLGTDDSRLRQTINRLGYAGRWRFVGLQAGDVVPTYSPFSLNGVTVRGAGIELTPGPFLLSVLHGQSERSTAPDTNALHAFPSFRRELDAVRIGVGAREGTHFHLIGLRARDAAGGAPLDSTVRVPPKENVSITPDAGLSLFDGALRLQGTGTVSALTRETRSTPIPLDEVPAGDLLNSLFKPRVGSRIDYATEGTAEVRFRQAGLTVGYERIQPGFESLGVPYLRSDQETFRVRPRVQVLGGRLLLDGTVALSRDNLADNRLATERRGEAGVNAQTQLGRLTLAAAILRFSSDLTPVSDSAALIAPAHGQTMHSLTLTPALSLPWGSATQLVSLSVTAQELAHDASTPASGAPMPGFRNLASVLTWVLAMPTGVSLNANVSALRADAGTLDTRVTGAAIGAGHRVRGGALSVNASAGASSTRVTLPAEVTDSRQFRADAGASYRLTPARSMRFTVQGLSSTARSATVPGFRELRSELRYEHALAVR